MTVGKCALNFIRTLSISILELQQIIQHKMFVVHMKRTFNIKIFNTSQQVRYKSNLVIIGAGWGGFRLARDIDKEKYNVTILSPRNHFLFTPLLPSTSVGTLEFRCVQGESWRTAPFSNY